MSDYVGDTQKWAVNRFSKSGSKPHLAGEVYLEIIRQAARNLLAGNLQEGGDCEVEFILEGNILRARRMIDQLAKDLAAAQIIMEQNRPFALDNEAIRHGLDPQDDGDIEDDGRPLDEPLGD